MAAALVSSGGCMGMNDPYVSDDGYGWVVSGDCPCNSAAGGVAYPSPAYPSPVQQAGLPAPPAGSSRVVPASFTPPQTKEPPR